MPDDIINLYIKCKNRQNDFAKPKKAGNNSYEIEPQLKSDIYKIKEIYKDFIPETSVLVNDINKYDTFIKQNNKSDNKKDAEMFGLSSIPYIRRYIGVNDAFNSGKYLIAILKGLILFINIPEDSRDLKNMFGQLKGKPSKIPYDYQVPFSFFRGTFLDKPLKKLVNSENERIQDIGNKIFIADKTLYDTKPAEKILKLIGLKEEIKLKTTRLNINDKPIKAIKIEGNLPVKIIGRTLQRIPVITFGLFSLLELEPIFKAFKGNENKKINYDKGTKQIIKSAISFTSSLFLGGLFGAAGAYLGQAGSLAGLGIGTCLGIKLGKWLTDRF